MKLHKGFSLDISLYTNTEGNFQNRKSGACFSGSLMRNVLIVLGRKINVNIKHKVQIYL